MWLPFLSKLDASQEQRLTTLERLVAVHQVAIRNLEDHIQGEFLSIKTDVNLIAHSMTQLREEIETERKERFRTIMDGFSEASAGIVKTILASTWSELGISRTEVKSLKDRVLALESKAGK